MSDNTQETTITEKEKRKLTLIFTSEGEIDYTGVPLQTAHLANYYQDDDVPQTLCHKPLTEQTYRYGASYAATSVLVCEECRSKRKNRPYHKLGKPKKQDKPNWKGYTQSSGRAETQVSLTTWTPQKERDYRTRMTTMLVTKFPAYAFVGCRLGSKIVC